MHYPVMIYQDRHSWKFNEFLLQDEAAPFVYYHLPT